MTESTTTSKFLTKLENFGSCPTMQIESYLSFCSLIKINKSFVDPKYMMLLNMIRKRKWDF